MQKHAFAVVLISLFSCGGCASENVKGATSSSLPERLRDCYRNNQSAISRPPMTVPLAVELIRKIELDQFNALDARILASSILHGVIFDGVARSPAASDADGSLFIPYRASGDRFDIFRLVVDYLTSGESSPFPSDSLSTPELCFLHKMLSDTVAPRRRGDESSTCVHHTSMPLTYETMDEDDLISACPLKEGVVKTRWGPVALGHVVRGTASALNPSTVTFARIQEAINARENRNVTADPRAISTETSVNNVWVSALAADLAHVLLLRTDSSPEFGSKGFWNDTLLPRKFYLNSNNLDFTEDEVLGAVDALIIGSNVQEWYAGSGTMRLSQIIDMYYSERGVAYDRRYKAGSRSEALNNLLDAFNLAEQIVGSAKLLQGIATYDVLLEDDSIKELSLKLQDKFKEVAGALVKAYDNAEYIDGKKLKAPVEILVILDGSLDAYSAQQMLYALSEAAQVSHYGSKLGVINGQSGNWIANVTGELFKLFAGLYQAENEWPSTLSLGRSLETAIYYYQNKTTVDCVSDVMKPMGRAILIVSPNGRLTDNDLDRSKRALNSIKKSNPEVNVILAVSDDNKNSFTDLTNNFKDNDHVLSPQIDPVSLVDHVAETISNIPGNIINFYCDQSRAQRLEDYITPGVETFYEIRREYVEATNGIAVNFSNSNYGDLIVCAIADSDKICKDVTVKGEISFRSGEHCKDGRTCNLMYSVAVNSTKSICAENDCRFPDQVRLDIVWTRSSGCTLRTHHTISIIVSIMLIVMLH